MRIRWWCINVKLPSLIIPGISVCRNAAQGRMGTRMTATRKAIFRCDKTGGIQRIEPTDAVAIGVIFDVEFGEPRCIDGAKAQIFRRLGQGDDFDSGGYEVI